MILLSNKMDVCYLLVYVQEIRIQPYFCVKQGDFFLPLFPKDPVCINQGTKNASFGYV